MKSPEEIFEETWQELKDKLEVEILDMCPGSGAVAVALMLSEICLDKARYLALNWQDRATAKAWEKASKVFEETAHRVADIFGEQNLTREV